MATPLTSTASALTERFVTADTVALAGAAWTGAGAAGVAGAVWAEASGASAPSRVRPVRERVRDERPGRAVAEGVERIARMLGPQHEGRL
ncbi:hypothetical protein GCM10008937_26790 [Deinococcus depolymerans]|uniref:Uncharacterized protein n=1 Tax=Deinococcus depolymerans TaxID=392408 RepID=A0ABN1CF57_9DEIO